MGVWLQRICKKGLVFLGIGLAYSLTISIFLIGVHFYLPGWEIPFFLTAGILPAIVIVYYIERKNLQKIKCLWDQTWEAFFAKGK